MSRTNCAIGKDVVPASFKGVYFWCTEASIEGGRRGAEGEFPFSEDTAYADLGRKIRTFNLTAVFREDDHVGDATAFFLACESPGPGMLVHPTKGTQMVACRSVKITDKLEDAAGETTAELEFVEANPVGTGIGGMLFGMISSTLFATSQDSFMSNYQPTLASQPWRNDIINSAQQLINITANVTLQVLPPDAPVSERRDVLKMQEVAQDDGLAGKASNVDMALVNGFHTIPIYVSNPDKEFQLMRQLANAATFSSKLPAGVATESEEALLSRQRILAAIGMAEAAMARIYGYVDEALSTMDIVLAVFNGEAQAAYDNCDNALFMEIRNYAIQFEQMMNDLAYRLPGLVAVDFMGGVHPLVAAYTIYNDATRHRELEQRNKVDANGRFYSLVMGVAPT
jgi:prophage DNA circulation protein